MCCHHPCPSVPKALKPRFSVTLDENVCAPSKSQIFTKIKTLLSHFSLPLAQKINFTSPIPKKKKKRKKQKPLDSPSLFCDYAIPLPPSIIILKLSSILVLSNSFIPLSPEFIAFRFLSLKLH